MPTNKPEAPSPLMAKTMTAVPGPFDYLRNGLINQTTNPLSLKGEGWGEGD